MDVKNDFLKERYKGNSYLQKWTIGGGFSILQKKNLKHHHQEQNASRTTNFRLNSTKATEMERTLPWNGRQSLAKEVLPVDTAWQEEKRKTATIVEEPSDGLREKQKHGRRYGRGQTFLVFGNGQTVLGCIDSNNSSIDRLLNNQPSS